MYEIDVPHENYIEYCQAHISFKGTHNKRKFMVLWALWQFGELRYKSIHLIAGYDTTLASIKVALTRLVKYGYLVRTPRGRYKLLTKGLRFFYVACTLAGWCYEVDSSLRKRCYVLNIMPGKRLGHLSV